MLSCSMQALWSRTGLSHRCGCRACEQIIGVGRKTTSAARRRKPTFAEVFTACYTSMLCTATMVDTMRKDDRAKKIDSELRTVREELAELQARRQQRDETIREAYAAIDDHDFTPSDLSGPQNYTFWTHLDWMYDNLPAAKERRWAPRLTPSTLVDRLKWQQYGVETPDDGWSHVDAQIDRLKQEIRAEEANPQVVQRFPTTETHFEKACETTYGLISHLLGRAEWIRTFRLLNDGVYEQPDGVAAHRLHEAKITEVMGPQFWRKTPTNMKERFVLRRRLRRALDTGLYEVLEKDHSSNRRSSPLHQAWMAFDRRQENWDFRGWNREAAKDNTITLNNHLRGLVQDPSISLDELIGHICYNLLLSPFLPDIHTYNLLMAEFAKRKETKLFSIVANAVLTSRMQSTPATLALLVTGSAISKNEAWLTRGIGGIIGRDPRYGALICRRELPTATSERQYIHSKAPLYPILRESLITNLLHFQLFEAAASVFLACVASNARLGADIVQRVFQAHVESLDMQGALRLIRGLCLLTGEFCGMVRSLSAENFVTICRHLYALFDLCGLSTDISDDPGPTTLHGIDKQILLPLLTLMQHSRPALHPHNPALLREHRDATEPPISTVSSRVLQLESIDKELTRARRTLSSLELELVERTKESSAAGTTLLLAGMITAQSTIRLNQDFLACNYQIDERLIKSARDMKDRDEAWLYGMTDNADARDRPLSQSSITGPLYGHRRMSNIMSAADREARKHQAWTQRKSPRSYWYSSEAERPSLVMDVDRFRPREALAMDG